MGAPAVAVTALAKTRTGRKVTAGLILLMVLLTGALMTPVVAIPLAVAGQDVAETVTSPGDGPAVSGEWGYPLSGSYNTGRGYGYHPVENCAYCPKQHKGYDMDQPCGATIYAASAGTVINAGSMPGWGNTIRIDHGGGLVTLYGHMAWDSLRVDVGQTVTVGTPLGAEGSTGKSTGCHLHYEVQLDGVAIDPEPFMAARGLPLR